MTDNLKALYRERFNELERKQKTELWKTLCSSFLQKYIPENAVVLDIGAGYCDFINNIKAKIKYALDLNEDIVNFAYPDVKIINSPADNLSFIENNSVDVFFASNFFEHLKTKDQMSKILAEVFHKCKKGGLLIIIQPNIRYAYKEYWDFFDHVLPLSDKSLCEILETTGFKINEAIPKFLPYTTKSNLPKSSFFLNLYLKFPLFWNIFGKQMLIVAQKES